MGPAAYVDPVPVATELAFEVFVFSKRISHCWNGKWTMKRSLYHRHYIIKFNILQPNLCSKYTLFQSRTQGDATRNMFTSVK